jgi:hypothetical protein
VALSSAPSPLTAPSVAPSSAPSSCANCANPVTIDFEVAGDGTALTSSDYVRFQWYNKYGVTVTASSPSGYTPDGMARIFNTATPVTDDEGDADLGSPNLWCAASGPGRGRGGRSGMPGENCQALNNVLIIQESNKAVADDAACGGTLTFDFETPVTLQDFGLLDIDEDNLPQISVCTSDGGQHSFSAVGLGDNSYQKVEICLENVIQLQICFPGSGAVTHLDICVDNKSVAPAIASSEAPSVALSSAPSPLTAPAAAPSSAPSSCVNCPNPVTIDFEVAGDGTALTSSDYVRFQWFNKYGVTVTASSPSGYTPDGMARIFNTATPVTDDEGDADLGSPNLWCAAPGPGRGRGGRSGMPGENCQALNNVLIIQESDKAVADDAACGGTLTFDFETPTTLLNFGLLDIDEDNMAEISVCTSDGGQFSFSAAALGDNSYQKVDICLENVIQLQICFSGSGAVTHIELCPDNQNNSTTTVQGMSPSEFSRLLERALILRIYLLFVVCDPQVVIASEDFENGSTTGWMSGGTAFDSSLSTFLGPINQLNNEMSKVFTVPTDAQSATFEFLFYEIGNWQAGDSFTVTVDDTAVSLGDFSQSVDEGNRSGQSGQIQWSLTSDPSTATAEQHKVVIDIPSSYFTNDGTIDVGFTATLSASSTTASAGIDNVVVTANFACVAQAAGTSVKTPTNAPSVSYCSALVFPCDTTTDSVYICHFDNGVPTTQCVTEADANNVFLANNPNDLCGPCP